MPIQILVFAHYHENMVIEKEYVMFYEQSINSVMATICRPIVKHTCNPCVATVAQLRFSPTQGTS